MALDTQGLKPLDTTGLRPSQGSSADAGLDTSGLKALDTSGLRPAEGDGQRSFEDLSSMERGKNALRRGWLNLGVATNATGVLTQFNRATEGQQLLEEAKTNLQQVRQAVEAREDLPPEQKQFLIKQAQDRVVGAERNIDQARSRIVGNLEEMVQLREEAGEIPVNPTAQKAMESESFGEFWDYFSTDPVGVIGQIGVESLPLMAPSLVTGLAGGVTAGPVGFAAGMGAGSAGVEFGISLSNALQERGADLNDPESVKQVLREHGDEIRNEAATRAAAIGLFDAVTGALLTTRIVPKSAAGAGVTRRVAQEGAEVSAQMGAQMAGGAGGEATAQALTGEFQPGEIGAEAVGELITGPFDVAAAVVSGVRGGGRTEAEAGGEAPAGAAPGPRSRPQREGEETPEGVPEGAVRGETIIGREEPPDAPVGVRERARADTPPPTPGDVESPIPTETIQEGKETVQDAAGEMAASQILEQAGFPPISSRVNLTTEDGAQVEGTVIDAFEEGGVRGAKVQIDDGTVISEPFAALQGRVTPTEDAQDAEAARGAEARPEAGGPQAPPAEPESVETAPAAETPAEAARAPISRRDVEGESGRDTAVTATGREVPVRYAVVEAAELVPSQSDDGRVNPDYPAELQPRDRARAVSAQQVQDIAQRLNPRLLERSPRAADGAPIVDAGGIVESGNGRILAIRRAYQQGLETAEAYRNYLAEQGYPAEGMNQPVLVRVREGEMEAADRAAFTREANERDTLGMSATERAMADATAMSDGMLDLYEGGDVDAAANRPFVRSFLDQIVGRNEQAGMIAADGSMSQEAVRRIEGALLAKAYGDADLVASLVESPDSNIKAVGGALMDVAASWAQMRSDAQSGQIDSAMDQTERLLEAVRLIQRARREKRNVAEMVGQRDLMSGDALHPDAEAFLRLMFRNTRDWTQPAGREKLSEALKFYIDAAGRAQPGVDLLGEAAPEPARILETAKERQYGAEAAAEQQQDLLAQPEGSPGERVRPDGEGRAERPEPAPTQAGEPAPARAGEEGAGAEGQVGEARSQSVSLEEARREIEAAGGTVTSTGTRQASRPGENEPVETEFFRVELQQADGTTVVMNNISFPTMRRDLDRWLEIPSRTGSPAGLDALASARPQAPTEQERRDQAQHDIYARRIEEIEDPAELRAYAEELRTALMTDERTGLGSNRAWLNRTPKAHIASIDLDSLKWVNDNMGHDAGDRLIEVVGDAFREAGIAEDAFHVSGDEFYAHSEDEQRLRDAMDRAREYLREITVEGNGLQFTGPGFSYGIGTNIERAEEALHGEKTAREEAGERAARGERPRGVVEAAQAAEQEPAPRDREEAPEARTGEQAERPESDVEAAPTEASDPETRRLADHFARAFADDRTFRSITEARREAGKVLNRTIEPGTQDAKRVDEAVELGVVLRAREIAREEAGNPQQAYGRLVDLYGSMPNLSTRTSTSVAQQAYSTPVPLGYLASRLAGIGPRVSVYEPAAGNGALLIEADDNFVYANELNSDRAQNLRSSLPKAEVTENDAAEWRPRLRQFNVVIGNPPFGPVKDESGRNRRFQVNDRYETAEIDHAIAMNALESMRDDGSAVLLVGSVAKTARSEDARSDAYNGKAKREFYLTLYGDYNVVDHFTVAGELYEKQGAGWPVDVIVIRGRGPSERRVPAADPPRVYESWDDLGEVLDAEYPSPAPVARTADRGRDRGERESRPGDGRDRADRGAARPDRERGEPAPGERAGVREGPVAGQPGDTRPTEPAARERARPAEGERPAQRPRRDPVTIEGENARQVGYQPSSTTSSMGTLVPVNMQTSVQNALDGLQARVGDIDHYVATRLDYRPDELRNYFGAEQIDAIALALDNMEHGAGFIIGDQTGIGKGRVVAAVIRHALREGKTPIFVTEKPNLYGDMYRDLNDIGIRDMLGRAPQILMTNAAQTVPLDEQGNTLKTGTAANHNQLLSSMAASGRLEGYDMVFTTYSQMQTLRGETTPRMQFLEAMGRDGIVIFDESHNAGGSSQPGAAEERGGEQEMNRAVFARNLARSASGVLYSSATYAKRPEVMDLYATTDMRLAVSDINNLAEAIQKGGVPMQQVVASMLSESGQYLRRERSFDGVVYNAPVVKVPRQTYGEYSQALAAIQKFSEKWVTSVVKDLDKELKAEGKALSTDGATGGAGAASTNFTSIMHNLIDQMLLSLKSDVAAERAIKAIENGEKPVITVANTMGSFIHDYAEDVGAKPGDRVDLTFNSLLERYLVRTRWISMRRPFMKKGDKAEKKYLTDADLGPAAVRAFEQVRDTIQNMDLSGMPVSPIDHIRKRLQDGGYKVGEITGRTATLDYRPDGSYYRARPGKEVSIAGRRKAIAEFNGGTIDAMVINQAGSTGLSLHASETFKDQRKRRMILAQAEKNIDTHMQMLGRVHRTGQVVTPEYDQLVADVPAEKRPAAVLAKKMASLNANTTASRGGALMAEDVPDFMNQYGDEVAARIMADMPEIHAALGSPLSQGADGYESTDAMRKVTGRIPLLPIEQQEMIYEMLESEYRALLEQKEAAGESVLEAKTLDLDADIQDRRQVVAPESGNSPFADGVYVETADVKRLGKPYPTDRVIEMVAETLEIDASTISADNMDAAARAGREAADRMRRETEESFRAYRRQTLDDLENEATRRATENRLDGNVDRFRSILRTTPVGTSVRLLTDAGNLYGVVTRIHRTGRAQNPVALGSWKVTVAVTDASRQITIPMSQLFTRDTAPSDPGESQVIIERADNLLEGMPVIRAFDDMQTEARENRTIITGNILTGFDHVQGRGAIINFTDREGGVRQGILMPRDYEYEKQQQERPVDFRSAEQVMAFINRGHTVKSADKAIQVTLSDGQVRFDVAASKARGGRYYLDPGILGAAGQDFVKVGNHMRIDVSPGVAPSVLDEMKRAGAGFRATDNLSEAREIAGSVSGEAAPESGARFSLRDDFTSEADQVINDLKSRLQQLGISEQVALNLRLRIQAVADGKASEADGRYLRGVIEIAVTAPDATRTLNHEVIHALRDLGLIRAAEWRTLERAARADADRMEGIRSRYERIGLSEEAMVEEAVADMYADWAAARSETGGFMRRAFERIRDFLRALGNALTGRGYRTEDSVFRSVERGEVGRRQTRDARGRFTADTSTVREPGARFALSDPKVNDPMAKDGSVARQKATSQWIGSQPLDQAMRLPFHIFGGINEHGEWKWGHSLTKKAEIAIVNATFSEDGRFAWINPTLERARAGLLDRYGLDPAYVERERQRGLEQSHLMLQAEETMRTLQEADIGPEEAKVLQAVLTGEAVADADMAKLSEPIRNAIDDMGAEAVSLGLISAEAFERNRGAYLHRVYLKHETDQGGLSRFVARMAGRQRKKIIGNQFKGRGLWIEVNRDRLMRNIPGFRQAERGGAVVGERFRVLDKVEHEGQGTLQDIDPASQRKVLDRIYLPEGADVPQQLGDYVDRGIWEVRGTQGGNMVLWRDFTKAERESMGEIVDARYTIAKTYMVMAHDLSTGRFFRDIAMNEDWARSSEPRAGTWKDAQEYSRFWADPEVEWVRVPDTVIPKSRTKRYGALSDKWVRAEIWRDLHELENMQKANWWNTLLTQWKLNKTARSPVVHMNNVMSNVVLMDLADVRAVDLVQGIVSMIRQDQHYQDARDHGAFGSDVVSQELRKNVLQPILEEIQRDVQGGQDTIEGKVGVVGKLADAIWSRAKGLDRKMVDLYRLEDEVFRMATYMRKLSYGFEPNQAALEARDQFLNYDIRAPWINAARRSVLPFISYTYRAVPIVARSVALRPWKLAKYATIAYAVSALGYMLEPGDEDEERRSLREHETGHTWVGAPRMIRMPYSDAYGNPVFLDVRRWVPAGDVFDMNQGHSAIPIPAPLQFGGPLMLGAELMLNKRSFTGDEIVNDRTDDWWDKTSAVADWAWKSWMPSAAWIPGSWYWERIGNAATGGRDWQGRPYALREAIPSAFGVKLKPQDVQENLFWKGLEFDRVERELKADLRRAHRDHDRNLISGSDLEKQEHKIMRKLENLARERQRTFEGTER